MLVFEEWPGENRSTGRKTLGARKRNQQQTQPTFDAESGNRTRATLVGTTAPSLRLTLLMPTIINLRLTLKGGSSSHDVPK